MKTTILALILVACGAPATTEFDLQPAVDSGVILPCSGYIGATECTSGAVIECVDLTTDVKNCGKCGNECLLVEGCTAGTCVHL